MGMHCQCTECNQLHFLSFKCNSCRKVNSASLLFGAQILQVARLPYIDRDNRKVVVCKICSAAIKPTSRDGEDVKAIRDRHNESGDCDPKKKKKPTCPLRQCREMSYSKRSRDSRPPSPYKQYGFGTP
ncbi:hypothetical protein U1Q18_005430 [Sarracenia purpurea var. burkii]